MNENENRTYQILWSTAKIVFRGKCITINVYIKKEKRSQINFHLKILEKEPSKYKANRRKKQ